MKRIITAIAVSFCLAVHGGEAWAAPKVLVSIKPIHSLAAAVMDGVGAPDLLIGGAASVHSYAFKPSDARKVAMADVIFIVGPDLETYLQPSLKGLSHAKVVALETAPGVVRLPARHGGVWADDGDHDHGPTDPHLWLDPANAIAMTQTIEKTLSAADPAHAQRYRANAVREIALIKQTDDGIRATVARVRGKPYLVFHDAYQYFERRYGLKPAGAITVAPDRPVGPRRIVELRALVARRWAVCLFREPQFPPKLVDTVRENSSIRIGVLDPLGADQSPGPAQYPTILRALAQSLAHCLQ